MSVILLELFKKVLIRKVLNFLKICNLKVVYKLNGIIFELGVDLWFYILFWLGIFESNYY